jgi:acid phosphatase
VRIKRPKGKPALYRRVPCPKPKPKAKAKAASAPAKPAIVLDIDETSLSNYDGLAATGFSSIGTAIPAATGTGTAIAPTLSLYKDARARGVAVFFVTGRPSAIAGPTTDNLENVGYDQGWDDLRFKPADQGTEAFKAAARAAIEAKGYDIVLNLGDQESDLDGGHADRAFKLPNPYYFIAD